jgi:hypothetical protein
MKKWIIATLMTVGMFASQVTSGNAQPTAEPDETGTCRYTCSTNGQTYLTRNQCRAACGGGVCVIEAC